MTGMHQVKAIRKALKLTQEELADAIGVSQSNVSFYERGQTIPPPVGRRLIDAARSRGLVIDFNHVYGEAGLPPAANTPPSSEAAA